jgi:hypothetical protein
MAKKGPKGYINSKELYMEALYCKALGYRTKHLEDMLIIMVNKIITKFRYYNPDDKFDCINEALYIVLKNYDEFDEERSENVFAYYTEIIKRGLALGFKNITHGKHNEYVTYSLNAMYDDGSNRFNI